MYVYFSYMKSQRSDKLILDSISQVRTKAATPGAEISAPPCFHSHYTSVYNIVRYLFKLKFYCPAFPISIRLL